jgi:hypothetical protein
MSLRDSLQGVEKQGRVVWSPEVYVDGVYAVHVLPVASRIRVGKMPLRHVLLWAWGRTSSLATEGIDSKREEARVLEGLFDFDGVQIYKAVEVRYDGDEADSFRLKTYSQQRHPAAAFQHGSRSLSSLFAVWGCGRGTHKNLCRSGDAGDCL